MFQNCRIHAFVSAKLAPLYEQDLTEGNIYKISNFIVKEYRGDELNRCVRNDIHIFFADFTTLEKDSNNVPRIPQFSFDLWNMADLERIETDKRFLCGSPYIFFSKNIIVHNMSYFLNFVSNFQMLLVS